MSDVAVVALLGARLALGGCGRLGFDAGTGVGADASSGSGVTTAFYSTAMNVARVIIPISPVDPNRTLVICKYRSASSSGAATPICLLESATTLAVEIDDNAADPNVIVHVQVIELAPGTVVQRGLDLFPSETLTAAFTFEPVDLARSFVVIAGYSGVGVPDLDERTQITAELADPTTLALARADNGNTIPIGWQVVQLDGGRVLSGVATIADGAESATASIPAVEPTRAFAIATARGPSSVEGERLVRVRLADSTTVEMSRAIPTSVVDVAWFVIELADVTVQHGETLMGTLAVVQEPLSPVDAARTAAFISSSGGKLGDESDVDEVLCTSTLSASSLELARSTGALADTTVSWSVVEWAP